MHFKAVLFGAVGATLLFAAAPASAAMPSDFAPVTGDGASSSLVQKISHTVPAGARCVKWTRRWNTRHGFGHRRCVQWR
jgi:hypothetical protein